jgi:hypothetical protein
MRAILIDPHKLEIREVDDDFGDFRVIKQYLAQGERGPLSAPLSTGPRLAAEIMTFCDDEGYYRPGQKWFTIPNATMSPLAGYYIVLGTDREGDTLLLPRYVTVDRVAAIVAWIDEDHARSIAPPITPTTIEPDGPRQLFSHPIDFSDVRPLKEKPDAV